MMSYKILLNPFLKTGQFINSSSITLQTDQASNDSTQHADGTETSAPSPFVMQSPGSNLPILSNPQISDLDDFQLTPQRMLRSSMRTSLPGTRDLSVTRFTKGPSTSKAADASRIGETANKSKRAKKVAEEPGHGPPSTSQKPLHVGDTSDVRRATRSMSRAHPARLAQMVARQASPPPQSGQGRFSPLADDEEIITFSKCDSDMQGKLWEDRKWQLEQDEEVLLRFHDTLREGYVPPSSPLPQSCACTRGSHCRSRGQDISLRQMSCMTCSNSISLWCTSAFLDSPGEEADILCRGCWGADLGVASDIANRWDAVAHVTALGYEIPGFADFCARPMDEEGTPLRSPCTVNDRAHLLRIFRDLPDYESRIQVGVALSCRPAQEATPAPPLSVILSPSSALPPALPSSQPSTCSPLLAEEWESYNQGTSSPKPVLDRGTPVNIFPPSPDGEQIGAPSAKGTGRYSLRPGGRPSQSPG